MAQHLHGLAIDCGPCHREFSSFDRVSSRDAPVRGSDRLYVGRNLPRGSYWFGSDTIMQEGFAPDGELRCIRLSRNGFVYVDEPFSRTWHGPAVIPLGAPIIPELTLRGGVGTVHVGLVENLLIETWIVGDDWEGARAVSVQGFRNATLRKVRVGKAKATGPGQGYAIQLQRGTGFVVEDCVGSEVRHAFSPFGVQGGSIRRVVAELPESDGIDFGHGFCEEDLSFEDCYSGDTNAPVGNRFLWGSHRITIRNHRGCRDLLVYGNTSCRIEGGHFTGALRLFANQAGKRMAVEVAKWPFAKGFAEENGPEFRLVVTSAEAAIA